MKINIVYIIEWNLKDTSYILYFSLFQYILKYIKEKGSRNMLKDILTAAVIGFIIGFVFVLYLADFDFEEIWYSIWLALGLCFISTIMGAILGFMFCIITEKYELTEERTINLSTTSFYIENNNYIKIDQKYPINDVYLSNEKDSYFTVKEYTSNYGNTTMEGVLYIGEDMAKTNLSTFLSDVNFYFYATPSTVETEILSCPECNTSRNSGDNFCGNCGYKF